MTCTPSFSINNILYSILLLLDVNVNVNVQVNRGNRQNIFSQREGRGPRRPQVEGKGDHGHKKPDGSKKPTKPEANDESSSEQNE